MDDRDLRARFTPLIENEIAEIRRQSDETSEHRRPVELDQQSVGRVSRIDAMQMQAMANAIERRRKTRLVALDQALRRMADGEFGSCIACGEFMGARRLEVDPATPRCVACAGKG